MKAALYAEFQGPITIEQVPDPTPPVGGVVVEVRASGICRSDWHGWQGHDGDITALPHVPGHELAGEVVAVDRAVRDWQVGDRVTVPFCLGCGDCEPCRAGQQQVCDHDEQPGFTMWGALAEYVALPYADTNLVRVPDALDYADVASLGCRFVTAHRAVTAQGQVSVGEWVAVYGCGGVGLSAVMIAQAAGAQVIAVDINPAALTLAAQLGALHTVNAAEMDAAAVVEAVRDLSGGGVHLSLDALGSSITCRNSILSLRKQGRHVQVGLLAGEHTDPPLPMGAVVGRELALYGSHGMQAHAYPALLSMVERGAVNPGALVTRRLHLSDAPAIFAQMSTYDTVGINLVDRFD